MKTMLHKISSVVQSVNVIVVKNSRRLFSAQNVELVTKKKQNEIFLVGINRPEKRNCINHAVAKQLLQAFDEFHDDKTAKVAILYGEGGYFCSGWDLSTLANNNMELMKLDMKKYRPIGPTMMRFHKPVIAAIEGYAVAGGLELAITCDMIVAAEDAIFGVFNRRFGVPLVDGGTVRLAKIVGLSRAMDLMLTGRPLKASHALEFGLVNRVVPKNESLSAAVKLAECIAQFPQDCMNADRRSALYSAYDAKSYEDAFEYELENGLPILNKESVPGAQSFVQGVGKHGTFGKNEK